MAHNIHRAPNPAQVKATLYLGGNMGATPIDFAEIERYLLETVVPHFPGFTLHTSRGYWKGQAETVYMLVILATDTDALRNQVRHFAERYKTEFGQEAVAYDFTACDFTLDCWPFGPVKAYHKPGRGY